MTWQIGHEAGLIVRYFGIHESIRGDRFSHCGLIGRQTYPQNCPTRAAAEAQRQVLEVQRLQGEIGLRTTVTRLPEDQLHEADAVFRRLAGRPQPLSFYVEFALANYREPVTQKLLTEAVTEYLASKECEHEQDLLSETHLALMKRDLKRLEKHFPKATVAELTGARLVGYLEARRAAIKTYNNRRGIVSTFLKFALQRDWITDNPLAKIPPRRIRRRCAGAVTFTAQPAKDIMAFVEHTTPAQYRSLPCVCSLASGPASARVKSSGSSQST